jgi:asparagine synthase (glutamine-hydrolysing)
MLSGAEKKVTLSLMASRDLRTTLTHGRDLLRLGLIHPGLPALAWDLKRKQKTYLTYSTLASLARNFVYLHSRAAGEVQVAEFGVGRGGSATLLAWLAERYGGRLALFDVFGRIPPPTEVDGTRAQDRYRVITGRESQDYYGNLPDLLALLKAEISQVIEPDRVEFIQGRYEDTLARLDDQRRFDLVHIDCDWYASSRAVIDYLESHLNPGAILQVDDYSNWQGSRQAIDETGWLKPYPRRLVDGALVIDTGQRGVAAASPTRG